MTEPELDLTDDIDDLEEEPELFEDDNDFTELLSAPSTDLCDIVITFRYLGVFKARAIACMKELSKRRMDGDSFVFEEYIKTQMKTLPDLNAAIPKYSLPLAGLFKR